MKNQSKNNHLNLLFPHFNHYKKLYLIGFVLICIQNYGYIKIPELFKLLLQEITSTNQANIIYKYILFTLFYLFLTSTSIYLGRYLLIGISRKIEYNIKKILFEKLSHLPQSFYNTSQTGDLVSKLTNDIDDIRSLVGPGIMYIVNSFSRIGFIIPVMFLLNLRLLLLTICLMFILISIIYFINPYFKPLFNQMQITRSKINNQAWQILFGINTIKLNTMENLKKKQFTKSSLDYQKANIKLAQFSAIYFPVFPFILMMSEACFLLIGGIEIINLRLTREELIQFNLLLAATAFPILSIGWVMNIIQRGLSALSRIAEILNYQTEENQRTKILPNKPINIKVKDLSFKNDQGISLLKNISLNIQSGEMIGITGKVGSGKTLLIEHITNIISCKNNEITINEIPINHINSKNLYEKIAFVPQETFLFSSTVKENISFDQSEPFDLQRIKEVAKISDVDKDIQNFPNKYDTLIGERGVTLSGGQQQRIAIARALYKSKAEVIIFDDSLSKIDSQTEENIINSLKKLKSLKTIIFISHKISLLKFASKIHFIQNGEIVESGTHEELLKENKLYAKTAKLQKLEEDFK